MKGVLSALAWLLPAVALAQPLPPPGSSITIGNPIAGACTNGFVLFNNSGVLGCEAVAGTGTVTSVSGSGGTTGMTLAGGPITTAGTLTLGGTLAAANGGAGTVNGALKGNGSGLVTQAACADLSNGGTACPAATGTSGHTLPYLDGANTWSGAQTFGAVKGASTTQAGTTYTVQASDCGTMMIFTNAAAVTVTVPASIVPAAGTTCNMALWQQGAGQVAVNGSAVTPATLVSAHSYTKTFGANAVVGLSLTTISGTATANLTGDGA
jgi:hypothetical protein